MSCKYPLPKTRPDIVSAFQKLCRELSAADLTKLTERVDHYFAQLKSVRNTEEQNSELGPNLELARELAKRCQLLLQRYTEESSHQRALIVGAVEYFLLTDDAIPDSEAVVGYHDDALIINHVLEQLSLDCFVDPAAH